LEPTRDPRAKIARALSKEVFRQLRCAALQIDLTDFNHREQLVAFALPFRISMFAAQSLIEETQVVGAPKQIA
jgi:hypothetical protein